MEYVAAEVSNKGVVVMDVEERLGGFLLIAGLGVLEVGGLVNCERADESVSHLGSLFSFEQ